MLLIERPQTMLSQFGEISRTSSANNWQQKPETMGWPKDAYQRQRGPQENSRPKPKEASETETETDS